MSTRGQDPEYSKWPATNLSDGGQGSSSRRGRWRSLRQGGEEGGGGGSHRPGRRCGTAALWALHHLHRGTCTPLGHRRRSPSRLQTQTSDLLVSKTTGNSERAFMFKWFCGIPSQQFWKVPSSITNLGWADPLHDKSIKELALLSFHRSPFLINNIDHLSSSITLIILYTFLAVTTGRWRAKEKLFHSDKRLGTDKCHQAMNQTSHRGENLGLKPGVSMPSLDYGCAHRRRAALAREGDFKILSCITGLSIFETKK